MAEQADSGDRQSRRLGVVVGKRAVRKESKRITAERAGVAATQRSQNK